MQAADIAALGIANQREKPPWFGSDTGRPIHNAIVWQSRVTAPICERLKQDGLEGLFREPTGLVVDAYFSGTQVKHLLDAIPAPGSGPSGASCCSAPSTPLIWRLTGGRLHVTDVSNASRTLMFDIRKLDWDDELLKLLDVPGHAPQVQDTKAKSTARPCPRSARSHSDCGCRRRSTSRHVRPGLLSTRQRPRTPTAPAASCS